MSSLIQPKITKSLVILKTKLPSRTLELMKQYMDWAGFESENDFVQQAIEYVIYSDKNYKKTS